MIVEKPVATLNLWLYLATWRMSFLVDFCIPEQVIQIIIDVMIPFSTMTSSAYLSLPSRSLRPINSSPYVLFGNNLGVRT